jgi:tRNA-binding protein
MADDRREALPEVSAETFFSVDIRVGKVLRCELFPEARRPSYRLLIDFGPLGTRRSAGRFTDHYQPDDLVGRLVIAAVNLPPRQIGPVRSEHVVLLKPDLDCSPGDRIG